MTTPRVWLMRLLGTLTGRSREDDLREELEGHLEMLAEEHRRRGLSDAEARFAARRDLVLRSTTLPQVRSKKR